MGNILKSFTTERQYVINSGDASLMTQLLKNVVDFGTAAGMRYTYKLRGDIGGKTGTTNDNSDAWFIGFTPNLVAGAWVGCDQRFISLTSNMGFGGKAAMPIFAHFLKSVNDNKNILSDTTKHFVSNYEMGVKPNENNVPKQGNKNGVNYNDLYNEDE